MNDEAVERALDEIEKDERKYLRPIGFGGMLDLVLGVSRDKETPEPKPQTGFLRMLDPDYQDHVKTYDRKPRIQRGIGFGAMLDGATKGTE